MATVYGNAYLVIAATKADGSQAGPFSQTAPDLRGRILRYSHREEHFSFVIRPAFRHLELLNEESFPLLTRAWAFQERLLPGRIVHFSANDLVWQCHRRTDCECEASLFGNSIFKRVSGKRSVASKVEDDDWAKDKLYSFRDRWNTVVEEYSTLKLTHSTDFLPALSGLARQMQTQGRGVYHASVWEDSLIADLLWETDTPSPKRAKLWRAPTWSWASVEGSIRIPMNWWSKADYLLLKPEADKIFYKSLRAGTQIATSDPTGKILYGTLKVCGQLKTATLHRISWKPRRIKPSIAVGWKPKSNEVETCNLMMQGPEGNLLPQQSTNFKQDYDIWAEHGSTEGLLQVFCLRMPMMVKYPSYYESLFILVAVEPLGKHVYERVGIAVQMVGYDSEVKDPETKLGPDAFAS
ncbi:uncharacterized protein PAC_09315 [Phialocephala subalpina]|uniref:Heterokaryon incompatibility domain-containing protein n=1 Tax=Phialocephala subalpina TaxID=576137 RepID=A0A1L7X335_9HELO|nr:uncharacterized protein PAC_09315 [Phialocephala subalpina]